MARKNTFGRVFPMMFAEEDWVIPGRPVGYANSKAEAIRLVNEANYAEKRGKGWEPSLVVFGSQEKERLVFPSLPKTPAQMMAKYPVDEHGRPIIQHWLVPTWLRG